MTRLLPYLLIAALAVSAALYLTDKRVKALGQVHKAEMVERGRALYGPDGRP